VEGRRRRINIEQTNTKIGKGIREKGVKEVKV
jgi:hypothetical protein